MKYNPDSSKEYVLVYDYFVATEGPAVPDDPIYEKYSKEMLPQDTVVVNVHQIVERSALNDTMGTTGPLQFTVKDTGKTYKTHYGYMFADNTPENLERLAIARKLRQEWKEAEKRLRKANKQVATLRN